MSLLEVNNLTKTYSSGRKWMGRSARAAAVDDVSFTLDKGECLAVVGESGAGKSTVGRLVLRLIEADSGTITFDGMDVRRAGASSLRDLRQRMQMVFQDPHSSLNPRMTVAEAVAEPFVVHTDLSRQDRQAKVVKLLDLVGLGARYLGRYPGELSGGQLQRISIARALSLNPSLIVCDEPVAALDVSVRAQVLNLLSDLQDEFGLAYLFVCHDLSLVEAIADRVLVMAGGKLVESGTVSAIFQKPQKDYTKQLLGAVPNPVPIGCR